MKTKIKILETTSPCILNRTSHLRNQPTEDRTFFAAKRSETMLDVVGSYEFGTLKLRQGQRRDPMPQAVFLCGPASVFEAETPPPRPEPVIEETCLQEALRRHLGDGLQGVGGEAAVVERVPVLLRGTRERLIANGIQINEPEGAALWSTRRRTCNFLANSSRLPRPPIACPLLQP